MLTVLDAILIFVQLVLLGLAVIIITMVIVLRRAHARYAHLPGPPRDSFLWGNWTSYNARKTAGVYTYSILYDWCMEYGNTYVIFFMYTPMVITIDEAAVKDILVTGNNKKTYLVYRTISFLFGHKFLGQGMVSDCEYSSWAPRRAAMNPAFNTQMLKPMMVDFNRTSEDLMEKLNEFVDMGYIRLLDQLNKTTLDMIGKVAFQLDLNSLNNDRSPFASAISKAMEAFDVEQVHPFARLVPWLLRKYKDEVGEACTTLRAFARNILKERRGAMDRGEYVPHDILAHLMKTFEDKDQDAIEVAIDDFLTFFLAGQETTANTISFALMEMGRNVAVVNKARTELDNVLGERSEIQYEDLARMSYLDDIIRESLRLGPPIGGSMRTVVKDMAIGGFYIPKDTIVVVSTYISSRHPDLHPAAERFWPERWQRDDTRPSSYVSYPFSLGPRSCIGQNFARMEAKVILAKFLLRFNYELDPGQSFEMEEKLTIKPKDGVRARIFTRN